MDKAHLVLYKMNEVDKNKHSEKIEDFCCISNQTKQKIREIKNGINFLNIVKKQVVVDERFGDTGRKYTLNEILPEKVAELLKISKKFEEIGAETGERSVIGNQANSLADKITTAGNDIINQMNKARTGEKALGL